MKIFISWSGPHSRAIAEVVRTWLDDVFDAAEPFMSQSDIVGGTRPLQRIEDELAGARFGVIIVTAANQHAPWITFEAGALSKVIDDAVQYVMPMLVDLRISDLTGPLTQFQAAVLDDAGVKKMVTSIGHALGMDKAVSGRKFETFWPRLRDQLQEIQPEADAAAVPTRGLEEVAEEILTHVRALRQESASELRTLSGRTLSSRRTPSGGFLTFGDTAVNRDQANRKVVEQLDLLGIKVTAIQHTLGGGATVLVSGDGSEETARVVQRVAAENFGSEPTVLFPANGTRFDPGAPPGDEPRLDLV